MPVDRRASNAELLGDLSNGVSAFPIRTGLVVHGLGEGDLVWAKFGLLATGAPTGTRGSQTVPGSFRHQRVLELGDRADDGKEQSTDRSGSINPLVQHDQVDLVILQLVRQPDEVLQGTTESIEFGGLYDLECPW